MENIATGNQKKNTPIKNFIIKPLFAGLYGYAIFFTVIIICKAMGCYVGTVNQFIIDSGDSLLALIGFVLMFMIRFMENFSRDDSVGKESV